uniref:Uncharacterized protein n=1 Tax=Anguilla anguilla TaxID=7936 RepID=A0A0E9WJL1_ANGAN
MILVSQSQAGGVTSAGGDQQSSVEFRLGDFWIKIRNKKIFSIIPCHGSVFCLCLFLLGRQMAALLFCVLLVPCVIVLLFSIVQLLLFGRFVFPSLSVA